MIRLGFRLMPLLAMPLICVPVSGIAQNSEQDVLRSLAVEQVRRDRPEYKDVPTDSVLLALTILGTGPSGARFWWAESQWKLYLLATIADTPFRLGGFEPNDAARFGAVLGPVLGDSLLAFSQHLSRVGDPYGGWAVFAADDADSTRYATQLRALLAERRPATFPSEPSVTARGNGTDVDFTVLTENHKTRQWYFVRHTFNFDHNRILQSWTYELGPQLDVPAPPNGWETVHWMFDR